MSNVHLFGMSGKLIIGLFTGRLHNLFMRTSPDGGGGMTGLQHTHGKTSQVSVLPRGYHLSNHNVTPEKRMFAPHP